MLCRKKLMIHPFNLEGFVTRKIMREIDMGVDQSVWPIGATPLSMSE